MSRAKANAGGSQVLFADQVGICSDQVTDRTGGEQKRPRRTVQRQPQAQPADAQPGPRPSPIRRRDPQARGIFE
jgi:hypothetical protein